MTAWCHKPVTQERQSSLATMGYNGIAARCNVPDCSFSSDDHKRNVGHDIENQKYDFKQPEKRVNDDIVGFSRNGEPFALYAIHEIRGEHKKHCPQNQDAAIYDGAPHEKRCEYLNIHNIFLYLFTFTDRAQPRKDKASTPSLLRA